MPASTGRAISHASRRRSSAVQGTVLPRCRATARSSQHAAPVPISRNVTARGGALGDPRAHQHVHEYLYRDAQRECFEDQRREAAGSAAQERQAETGKQDHDQGCEYGRRPKQVQECRMGRDEVWMARERPGIQGRDPLADAARREHECHRRREPGTEPRYRGQISESSHVGSPLPMRALTPRHPHCGTAGTNAPLCSNDCRPILG